MKTENKKTSPGSLIPEQKRIALIASCPVKKAGIKHRKFCVTCPLKPWCRPDKKEGC